MRDSKSERISGYLPEWVEVVRGSCLYLATVLGEFMENDLTIVGGLVPGLLIDKKPPEGAETHPGTTDLDVALKNDTGKSRRGSEMSASTWIRTNLAIRLGNAGGSAEKAERRLPSTS